MRKLTRLVERLKELGHDITLTGDYEDDVAILLKELAIQGRRVQRWERWGVMGPDMDLIGMVRDQNFAVATSSVYNRRAQDYGKPTGYKAIKITVIRE